VDIINVKYVTHDGVFVNASVKGGNFFSNDGIYPSPFGNSIIANEYIRTLNGAYGFSIPFIPTKEYLKNKGLTLLNLNTYEF
jgi:hypothetical protein